MRIFPVLLAIAISFIVIGCSPTATKEVTCSPGYSLVAGTCVPNQGQGSTSPPLGSGVDLFSQEVDSFVTTRDVPHGFLAKPVAPGNYPGVVMIHEWWGLNDNIKEMAKILAKQGYVVYAVDLYDGESTNLTERATQLSQQVAANETAAVDIMKGAAQYLRDNEHVTKVASLGWCFGGGQSLQLSLNQGMDATVIYYGMLTSDESQLKSLKGPVLGIFGDADTVVPVTSVRSFQSALKGLNKPIDIYVYPGLGHAFANPTGANYAKVQTVDAWNKTVSFLDLNLKSGKAGSIPASPPTTGSQGSTDNGTVTSTKVFKVSGKNFRFYMDGKESPELRVKQGDRVRIEFTNEEGFHDWVIDEFNAKTKRINGRESDSVEFIADKKGTFEYYCSVGTHRQMGMNGNLIVE
jgi:carboxymethylenebutenolidase